MRAQPKRFFRFTFYSIIPCQIFDIATQMYGLVPCREYVPGQRFAMRLSIDHNWEGGFSTQNVREKLSVYPEPEHSLVHFNALPELEPLVRTLREGVTHAYGDSFAPCMAALGCGMALEHPVERVSSAQCDIGHSQLTDLLPFEENKGHSGPLRTVQPGSSQLWHCRPLLFHCQSCTTTADTSPSTGSPEALVPL